MQWQVLRRWPEEIDNPGGVRGERAPVTRCLQRPGSILFLPSQWWHATLNVDDCVGVGGHMHDGIDRAFKAQVVTRVGTEEKRVTEYGWEVHPFSGQMTMTLARRKMKVGKPVDVYGLGTLQTPSLLIQHVSLWHPPGARDVSTQNVGCRRVALPAAFVAISLLAAQETSPA